MRPKVAALVAALIAAAPASAGMRARYGGELRVAVPSIPASLDPAWLASPTDVAMGRLVYGTLFELAADNTLSPELALGMPETDPSGRLVRIKLRPGIRFHDGTPVSSIDVVASLARLADASLSSPFTVVTLPLAENGRGPALTATSENELTASFAFAYPDWPRALAHPAAAILPGGAPSTRPIGTGPLLLRAPLAGDDVRLSAFSDGPLGRAFADSVRLAALDARGAGRALSLGEADAVLGSTDKRAVEGPALFATYLALNAAKLGSGLVAALRQSIESSVDPADLARYFVRGAVPLDRLLPAALGGSAPARSSRPARPALPPGLQLVLLTDRTLEDQRAVAERLQVKLHDFGVSVQIKKLSRPELRQALAEGRYDVALVAFALLPEPGLAMAQLVHFTQGREAARDLLRRVGAGADPAARRAVAVAQSAALHERIPLLPLYVQVPRVLVRAGVAPISFDGCGAPMLADAWFMEVRPPAASR